MKCTGRDAVRLTWCKHPMLFCGIPYLIYDSGRGLQLIPDAAIDDLSKFFVPSDKQEREYVSESLISPVLQQKAFRRNFTAPTTTDASKSRFATRQSTRSVLSLGVPREEIHLQLRNNAISVLPIDLFDLQKLTLLGLRTSIYLLAVAQDTDRGAHRAKSPDIHPSRNRSAGKPSRAQPFNEQT